MKIQTKKGSLLVEILVGISVFSLGLTATVSLLQTNTIGVTNSAHRLTAIGLAREGLEAARQIRDSNILLCPSEKDNLWKDWTRSDSLNSCTDNAAAGDIASGAFFTVGKNVNDLWVMGNQTNDNTRTVFSLCLDKAEATFFHPATICTDTGAIESIFERVIDIQYCNADGSSCDTNKDKDVAKITVTIEWDETGARNKGNLILDTFLHKDVHNSI
jgi:hypothetical protein